MLDNMFLEEEVNFLRSKIKTLEEKVNTLEKNLNESRACRIRLVDENQKITDKHLAIVTKNSSMLDSLITERKKILVLVEENKKLKGYYELFFKELNETNRGVFAIVKEYQD